MKGQGSEMLAMIREEALQNLHPQRVASDTILGARVLDCLQQLQLAASHEPSPDLSSGVVDDMLRSPRNLRI